MLELSWQVWFHKIEKWIHRWDIVCRMIWNSKISNWISRVPWMILCPLWLAKLMIPASSNSSDSPLNRTANFLPFNSFRKQVMLSADLKNRSINSARYLLLVNQLQPLIKVIWWRKSNLIKWHQSCKVKTKWNSGGRLSKPKKSRKIRLTWKRSKEQRNNEILVKNEDRMRH